MHKWGMVCEIAQAHDPDIFALSETGANNEPSTLRWLTRTLFPLSHITEDNVVHKHMDALPYHILSSHGSHHTVNEGGW
jgi:hypothetical protein